MWSVIVLFCFSFFGGSVHSTTNNAFYHQQQKVLLDFKSVVYDPWNTLADWSPSRSICNWTGISCNNQSELVVSLDLSYRDLQGTISPSLTNISFLQSINLFANSFQGHIPAQLGSLFRLKVLSLRRNVLVGSIPSALANLSALTFLDLGENNLEGAIPAELGKLNRLEFLYIDENKLSRSVPMALGNLSLLRLLDLRSNSLFTDDTYSWSFLVGLSNCPQLQTIRLDSNRLTGALPDTIGQLSPTLSVLDLSGNALGGNMPYHISKLTNLVFLDLSANRFSGTIPSLATLQNLQELHLQNNTLEGAIPDDFAKLKTMRFLDISHNKLAGRIPECISSLQQLTQLLLHHNHFSEMMPPSLGYCKNLQLLDLSYNALNGSIPQEVANLSNIQYYLNLSNNHLKGPLPGEIGNMVGAQAIDISGNLLNGFIPATLGKCTSLQVLNLSRNVFHGIIPDSLGDLHNLMYMDLSRNKLEGEIPDSLGNLSILMQLDLSSNHMSGRIPKSLHKLMQLQSLSLSQNYLNGSIPDSFRTLQNLECLDLSNNSLSGTMPVCLKKLKMLSYLNLSFNSLEGDVDKGGDFQNSSIVVSLIGNSGLCGSRVSFLPACHSENSHSAFLKKVLGIAFVFCCLLLSFLWWKFKRHQSQAIQRVQQSQAILEFLQNVKHPRISYDELFLATNGFNQANLVGVSSFGSVYKGMLTDGTGVAVKVFNLNKRSEKSFVAECNVLQKVRHRNLARIITMCSNLNFKGLVFEFMDNGSLEEHLYPDSGHVSELELEELLSIAIDIANAVEYLHYDCYVHIVHCDIKPSNVLLDNDMTARLTDFGISRLMYGTSTDSLASTINLNGSVGYIAPEYGLGGRISLRGDVYSYGILLLEMLTLKKPTDEMFEGDLNLHKWVKGAYPNQIAEVVDQSLLEQGRNREVEECVVSMLRIGLLCSNDSAEARPTMREVSNLLKTVRGKWEVSPNTSQNIRPCIADLIDYNSSIIEVEDSSSTTSLNSNSEFDIYRE